MKILHILNKPMPPTGKDGGLPVMVDVLARAQIEKNYKVSVATCSSHRHKDLSILNKPYKIYNLMDRGFEENLIGIIRKGNYSLVHLHNDNRTIKKFCLDNKLGYVRTEHSIVSPKLCTPDFFKNVVFVSKSHAQQHQRTAYVHNGIDIDSFKYIEKKEDYLLFLGKVSRSKKGAADAVRVAKYLRHPLMVVGGRNNRLPSTWLSWPGSIIKPAGVLWGEKKFNALARAKCLLVPSRWDEPFGLIMLEALASGTPVIAYNKGAASEIIKHGKTGFLCNDWKEMAERVSDIPALCPQDCLKDVRLRFSAASMAKGYIPYYKRALRRDDW